MQAQVINLYSPDAFNLFNAVYSFNKLKSYKGMLGLELRDIPEGILDKITSHSFPFSIYKRTDTASIFLTGTMESLERCSEQILEKYNEAGEYITSALKNYSAYDNMRYNIAGRKFSFNNSYIMGILNVTPDSFSDGGRYYDKKAALARAFEMIEEGADIIDIGGESTRPGAEQVSEKEELGRVLPIIEGILKSKKDAVLSIDTTKSRVAEEAIKAGASIINDISGLVFDVKIAEVAASHNVSLVIMHIKGTPENMQKNPEYKDVVSEVYDHLSKQAELAHKAGVKNIIIDPGIGFGKSMEHNLELIKRLNDFKSLGYPILIGLSRKSFIGNYLNLQVEDRDNASVIADAIALMKGARIIRTHNIKNGVMARELFNRLN